MKPIDIIKKVTLNINKTKTEKYNIEPEEAERKALSDDIFREKFDFCRLEKVGKHATRLDRYNLKKDTQQPRKLRDPLSIGENVLVLAERLKKKDTPGRLYKSTTQNKAFFNKNNRYIIRKRVKTTCNDWYYWVSEENPEITNKFRYLRQELYALNDQ